MHCTFQGFQISILRSRVTIAERPDLKRSYCTDILTSTRSYCKILRLRLLYACVHENRECTNTGHRVGMVTIFCIVAYLLIVRELASYLTFGT